MEKYIPVKTQKDQQSLTEFLNKGWIVKFVNSVKEVSRDDEFYDKKVYNEYIISDELINKPVETTNEQPLMNKIKLLRAEYKKEWTENGYTSLGSLLSKLDKIIG